MHVGTARFVVDKSLVVLKCVEDGQIVSYLHCVFFACFVFWACTPKAQNTKLAQAITIASLIAMLEQV